MLAEEAVDCNLIVSLVNSCGFIPLSYAAMREVGSAALTLGAIYDMKNRQTMSTFAGVKKIARRAMVSTKTARRHLIQLDMTEWLMKQPHRRTHSYFLTEKALNHKKPYAMLPGWWKETGFAQKWVSAFVYAAILGFWHMTVKPTTDPIPYERMYLSLTQLQRKTGRSRPAIIEALRFLKATGLIRRGDEVPDYGTIWEPQDCGRLIGISGEKMGNDLVRN
jgi:hypothetical protein